MLASFCQMARDKFHLGHLQIVILMIPFIQTTTAKGEKQEAQHNPENNQYLAYLQSITLTEQS